MFYKNKDHCSPSGGWTRTEVPLLEWITGSTLMKKFLITSLICLMVLGIGTGTERAFGFFRWLKCHRCNKFSTHITIRPYNAFTPICSGSLFCDGCSPFQGGCNPFMMGGCGMPPMYTPGYGCGPMMGCCDYGPPSSCTSGCCDSGCLPAPAGGGVQESGEPMAPPSQNGSGFNAPAPTPLPTMSYYYRMPVGHQNVQPVGYYNNYYPQQYNWGYNGYYPQQYNYNYGYQNYYNQYQGYGYGYPAYGFGR